MIYESIVTTVDESNTVHIAPMGIRHKGNHVVISPFKPSQTLHNLEATKSAVVNVTDDVRVFAGCLTGRHNWPTHGASAVQGKILDAALAYEELVVERIENDDLRPKIYLKCVLSKTVRPFAGFNRAQAAVIEAAILVSRLSMLPAEKIDQEMEYLEIAVSKTAGEREMEAWLWLKEAIVDFRNSRVRIATD